MRRTGPCTTLITNSQKPFWKTTAAQRRDCALPGRWCETCGLYVCRYHWITWHFTHQIDPPFGKIPK